MKQKNSLKFNILKKMVSKRVAVISDYVKNEHWYGEVEEVVDESNLKVKNADGEVIKVNIFDIRNPAQEL